MSDPDIGRIKRNISKMIDMGAPEADIDAYLAEEGVSLAQLRGSKAASTKPSGPPPDRSVQDTYKVLERLVKELYPHAQITSDKRTPEHNRAVGGVENSFHVSGDALDIVGLSPEERSDLKSQLEGMGIKFDEFLYHKVKGGGMHLHMASTHVPEELYPQPENSPAADAPESSTPQNSDLPPSQDDKPPVHRAERPDDGWNNFFTLPNADQLGEGLAKGAGSVAEGIGDTLGIVGAPINALINKATGSHLSTDFGKALRETLHLPKNTNRVADDLVSGATGGLTFAGAAGAGARGTSGLVQKALGELGATPIRDAAAGAAAALSGDAAEAAGAGPVGQTIASIAGGMAGHGTGTLVNNVRPEVKATRFATREAKDNPFAAFDAEIVEDLAKARDTAVGPHDPKGRAPVTAKTINSVEQRYTAQFKTAINQLDLPKIDKMRLHAAIEGKYSLPAEDIASLRGSVAGDAVADAITKVQRVRALTPELARNPGLVATTGRLAAAGADLLPIPGVTGRAIRYVTKATAGDAEAARVHAAQNLLDKQRAYSKLRDMVGPSGQRESQQGLWDAADAALAAKEAEASAPDPLKLARQREAAWSAKQKMQGTQAPSPSQRARQEDAAWNQRNRENAITPAQKQAQENAAWAEADPVVNVPKSVTNSEISGWENITKLARDRMARDAAAAKASAPAVSFDGPTPVKPPKALPLREQLIEKAVGDGIVGSSRTRDAFKERLGGIDDQQLDAALDQVSKDLPEASPELDRIRLNHPTMDRKFGSAITPHLQSAMEKLGITPPPKGTKPAVPVDDAAQARLADAGGAVMTAAKPASAREADLLAEMDKINPVMAELADGVPVRASDMGEQLDDVTTKRVGEINTELAQLRKVDRPIQWEQGKNRYVGQANDAISGFQADKSIHDTTKSIIGSAPVQIRDNFKTTDDALRFIDERVLPDLQAEGVHPEEIASVKSYLSDIAHAKPYYDATAFERGTRANPRGRPTKD